MSLSCSYFVEAHLILICCPDKLPSLLRQLQLQPPCTADHTGSQSKPPPTCSTSASTSAKAAIPVVATMAAKAWACHLASLPGRSCESTQLITCRWVHTRGGLLTRQTYKGRPGASMWSSAPSAPSLGHGIRCSKCY